MMIDRDENWRPGIATAMLRARAELMQKTRTFMEEQRVLEVETPLLVHAPVTEVHIDSFCAQSEYSGNNRPENLYLHTSPEYAMKRLLAAGSGAIYQICKVFRKGESGNRHNPEFTMLEWYQPGYDHHDLMDDLQRLLQALNLPSVGKQRYTDVFMEVTQLDPHTAATDELQSCAGKLGLAGNTDDRHVLLDFIFSHAVAPALGHDQPVCIYDFPACQAALARLTPTTPALAERFELFINGMEIANGFHELTDPVEQRQRFEDDNRRRLIAGKSAMPLDERLLAALEAGLPDCAGLALGIDRLLMAVHQCQSIGDVLAFPIERA